MRDTTRFRATDIGRGLLHVIHDVAPGAELLFHTFEDDIRNQTNGDVTADSVITALNALEAAGADIILDFSEFLPSTIFQDGAVAQAIEAYTQRGGIFVSPAGNNGILSYESPFRAGETFTFRGIEYAAHDFDPGERVDLFQDIQLTDESDINLLMNWQQASGAVESNFELFLVDRPQLPGAGGEVLSQSRFPIDAFTDIFDSTNDPAQSISFRRTPEFGDDSIEVQNFSSSGAAPILFDAQGNPLAVPEIRQKPDVIGPTNVSTPGTFFFPRIPATIGAAAHVTGLIALMLQRAGGPGSLTADQVRDILRETDLPVVPRPNLPADSGFVQADAAVMQTALFQQFGTAGADELQGQISADNLYGLEGDDTLAGGAGFDALFGGHGADTLRGGRDGDALMGEAGRDRLQGGQGDDLLMGDSGGDRLNGGKGSDTLLGEQGRDELVAVRGATSSKGATAAMSLCWTILEGLLSATLKMGWIGWRSPLTQIENRLSASPGEDNDITANAFSGRGGTIQIEADNIVGLQQRSATPGNGTNDIDASSRFQESGRIIIRNPSTTNPTEGLIELPDEVADTVPQIVTTCPTSGDIAAELGEFIVTGRGGIPENPADILGSQTLISRLATASETNSQPTTTAIAPPLLPPLPHPSTHPPTHPIEAQTWTRTPSGTIILTAAASPSATAALPAVNCSTLANPEA